MRQTEGVGGRSISVSSIARASRKVPVDDLLAYVKDDLAALAKKKDLALITMEFNYKAPNVEIVDVTDEIVRLYNPSERTLKIVEQIKEHKPVDLDEVEQHHDHE